ncbi:HNH endonuclease [Sphingobacterium sp. R2]|uniref:HNH endonuclease n=1 Tax=Sphingobacterium sp. R2 TaxID=3112958 RepID=UPI00345D5607
MWKRIPKEKSIPPTIGKYSDWKPLLAVEGYHQCLYCTISESSFGGIRNFHVEHYRPKGIPRFSHLENDYSNLYYACAICNTFKSDDWPDDPDEMLTKACYPDPSKVDYALLFGVDGITGLATGKNLTGIYLSNKLYLNRAQLIIERRSRIAKKRYEELINIIIEQKKVLFNLAKSGNKNALILLENLDQKLSQVEAIFHLKDSTNPYNSNQTKKLTS